MRELCVHKENNELCMIGNPHNSSNRCQDLNKLQAKTELRTDETLFRTGNRIKRRKKRERKERERKEKEKEKDERKSRKKKEEMKKKKEQRKRKNKEKQKEKTKGKKQKEKQRESCTFSILTPYSHEARQFAHSKSEAVAPRYSWATGTTAQSPSRCSDVLPPSRMSSANNVLAQEPSLRPSSNRGARRRDPGEAGTPGKLGPSQVHPAVPRKARHSFPYGQTMGKPANAAFGST